jgi:hypothetical protein
MNPNSIRKDIPSNSKTPIPQNKVVAISRANSAVLEKPKPAVSTPQSLQAKATATNLNSKQINTTPKSNTPKTPVPITKPKPTPQVQVPVVKPKTAPTNNALSTLPSLKQETPSLKKESQPNTKKVTPNLPSVKKTPSSAVVPKPPSTNSLPSVKKTPSTKPMISSASMKDVTQPVASKKTGPLPNQKKSAKF